MQRLVGDAELVAAPDLAARQHDALLDIVCVGYAQSRSQSACFTSSAACPKLELPADGKFGVEKPRQGRAEVLRQYWMPTRYAGAS